MASCTAKAVFSYFFLLTKKWTFLEILLICQVVFLTNCFCCFVFSYSAETEPRASHMLGKCPTPEPQPHCLLQFLLFSVIVGYSVKLHKIWEGKPSITKRRLYYLSPSKWLFFETESHPGWPQSCDPLPRPPSCWDHGNAPSQPALFFILDYKLFPRLGYTVQSHTLLFGLSDNTLVCVCVGLTREG